MPLELYLAFVVTVAALILMPGPNVALIVATSVAHGTRFGLLAVLGTSTAMILQLAITAFGLTAVLAFFGAWFEWLRWLGVLYLIGLAVQHWRKDGEDLVRVSASQLSKSAVFARGFLVSLINPKTLLFYGAFFPQFIVADRDLTTQLAILCSTFLALALLLDSAWALGAGRARRWLGQRGRLRNRITACVLASAALGLAAART